MKKIKKDDFIEFLEKFPKKKVDGKTFEEWIKLENRSLWWFVRLSFLNSHCPFSNLSFDSLSKSINEKHVSKWSNVRTRFFLFFFNKLFFLNELFRWFTSIFSKDTFYPKTNKKNVMFFTHTNALLKKGKFYEIDRVENLRVLINKQKNMNSYVSTIEPPSQNSFFNLAKFSNLVYKHITFKMFFKSFIESIKLSRKKNRFLKRLKCSNLKEKELFNSLKPLFLFYLSFERILSIVLYYNLYKRVIKKKKIDFVLFYSTTDAISRCAIAASDDKDIFAGTIQHGIGLNYVNLELPDKFLYFVPGEVYKQILCSLGSKKESIHPVGALFLSDIIDFIGKGKSYSKKVLFITAQYVKAGFISEENYTRIIKSTYEAFQKCEDYKFIHKPHPQEGGLQIYKKIMRDLKIKNVYFDKNSKTKKDLYKQITDCEFVVSLGSTVDIEALILKKPVIFLDLIPQDDGGYFPHYKYPDAFITIKNKEQIYSTLKGIINKRKGLSESSLKFVKDHFSSFDRKVPDRILKIIQTYLKS